MTFQDNFKEAKDSATQVVNFIKQTGLISIVIIYLVFFVFTLIFKGIIVNVSAVIYQSLMTSNFLGINLLPLLLVFFILALCVTLLIFYFQFVRFAIAFRHHFTFIVRAKMKGIPDYLTETDKKMLFSQYDELKASGKDAHYIMWPGIVVFAFSSLLYLAGLIRILMFIFILIYVCLPPLYFAIIDYLEVYMLKGPRQKAMITIGKPTKSKKERTVKAKDYFIVKPTPQGYYAFNSENPNLNFKVELIEDKLIKLIDKEGSHAIEMKDYKKKEYDIITEKVVHIQTDKYNY